MCGKILLVIPGAYSCFSSVLKNKKKWAVKRDTLHTWYFQEPEFTETMPFFSKILSMLSLYSLSFFVFSSIWSRKSTGYANSSV